MSDIDREEGADLLAAEYALGVLDLEGLRRAERRSRTDPAFAADVGRWQGRLAPMASAIEPVPAPPHLWSAIERDLDRMTRSRTVSAAPTRPGLGTRFWQWLSLGSAGVAFASLTALFIVTRADVPQTLHTAALASESGSSLFTAVVDAGDSSVTLIPVAAAAEAGVPELWLVPENGQPRSLGLVDPRLPMRIALPRDFFDAAGGGARLAVSMEPEGGSPTGQPTGPIVAHGLLQPV